MLEKGKISSLQMGFMLYSTVLATGFLVLPTITAQFAQNDLWLTGIFSAGMGFLTVYLANRLHGLYPKQTIIEYSNRILGKIPGKIVGLSFFFFSLHSMGLIVRQYAEFVKGNFLLKTPIIIIICSLILLCAFAVRGGAELMARSAVIFTLIFIIPLFILLLLLPDLDLKNVFPILSRGIMPVLKATTTPQGWISEIFLMSFFLPCLTDPQKGMRVGFITLCAIVASMVYVNLIVLFLFGVDAGNKIYPILTAFRYISLSNFFENLESLLLAMWVAGNFVKISVFYYAAVLSFAQSLELTDYRPVVLPLGILAVVFSLWDIPDFPALSKLLKDVSPFYIPTFLMAIPLFLLIVAVLRNKISGTK